MPDPTDHLSSPITQPASATVGVDDSAAGPRARVVLGIIAAVLVASALNVLIAAVAHAAGVSDAFAPLKPGTFVVFTLAGTLAATVGWALLRRLPQAHRLLRALVPAVLLVSLVPDALVGAGGSMEGASWGGAVALMVMHLVVAAVVVTMLLTVLPVRTIGPRTGSAVS